MEQKRLHANQDYILFNLVSALNLQLHTVISYMQNNTPYGPEYEAAFEKYKKINTELGEFEALLADTVAVRGL